MNRPSSFLAVLGTAHRRREAGKCSPDRSFFEFQFSRNVCRRVSQLLTTAGVDNLIDIEAEDLPREMWTSATLERSRELGLRVNIVNREVMADPSRACLYVSIHVNAMGDGSSWCSGRGWQVIVSPFASQNSIEAANLFAECAADAQLSVRRPLPKKNFWVQSLFVLDKTACPAVLTENLFQDNREDLALLTAPGAVQRFADLHYRAIMAYRSRLFS